MPELGIVDAAVGDGIFGFGWVAGGLCVVVVDKPCHAKFDGFGAVWCGIVGAMAMVVIDVEGLAAVHRPDCGRGGAALAGTEDRMGVCVRIGGIRNAKLSLDFIDCMLKHVALDGCDVAMEAVGSSHDARY